MAPSKPRQPPKKGETIEKQISGAIAQGFSTVLTDMKAQNAEILNALKEISRASRMKVASGVPAAAGVAQRAEEAAHTLSTRLDSPGNLATERFVPSAHDKDGGSTRDSIRDRLASSFATRAESWTMGAFGTMADGEMAGGGQRRLRPGVKIDSAGRYHYEDKYIKAADAYQTGHLDEHGGSEPAARISLNPAAVEEADGDETRFLRRGLMAGRAADVARAWQGGQPFGRALMSAAPNGALKAAGTASTVVHVANEGWQKVQEQYAKNRSYQEYFGGSNRQQFGERADQWFNKNVRGRFSLLGGDAYDTLWTQSQEMGLRGSHRNDYIGAGARLMGGGVSSDQTRELLSMTMESGGAVVAMRQLTDAIASVGQAARDSGVSAKEARAIFIENYKASSSNILGGGGGAITQAQAFTTSQVNMGHMYMNRVDYSGTMARNIQYANAQSLGMTPAQYSVDLQTNGPLNGMIVQENRARDQLNTLPSDSGRRFEDVVREFIRKLGRNLIPNSRDSYDLGLYLETYGFQQRMIADTLRNNGIKVDSDQAAPGIAANLFTSNTPSNVYDGLEKEKLSQLTGAPDLKYVKLGQTFSSTMDNSTPYSDAFNVQPGWNDALRDIYTKPGQGSNREVSRVPGTVELELLRNVGTFGLSPTSMVMVKAGNEDRVVTMQEAFEKHRDQITNGSAVVVEPGENMNKTIAEMMGFSTIKELTGKPTTSGNTNAGAGEDPEDYFASIKDEKKDEKGTTVMLDLTPRAAEILMEVTNREASSYGPTR